MPGIEFTRRTSEELNELYARVLMQFDTGESKFPRLSYEDGMLAVFHWMGKPFSGRDPLAWEREEQGE